MSDDYIKREDVYDQLDWWARDENNPQVYQRDDARYVIDGIPSSDVAPVRHGHWVDLRGEENETRAGYCSTCGWESHVYEDDVIGMPYCPNCGAKMDGDSNEID